MTKSNKSIPAAPIVSTAAKSTCRVQPVQKVTAANEPAALPPAPEVTAGAPATLQPASGKTGVLVDLLRRPEGVTIEAMAAATGWQHHSIRGVMSGTLKKKMGLNVVSDKSDTGRVYRITTAGAGRAA